MNRSLSLFGVACALTLGLFLAPRGIAVPIRTPYQSTITIIQVHHVHVGDIASLIKQVYMDAPHPIVCLDVQTNRIAVSGSAELVSDIRALIKHVENQTLQEQFPSINRVVVDLPDRIKHDRIGGLGIPKQEFGRFPNLMAPATRFPPSGTLNLNDLLNKMTINDPLPPRKRQ